jgi:hypothetical protein
MKFVIQALAVLAVLLVGTGWATADVIDFEAQGAGAGGSFTGALNSPLVIGSATFTGGQLLKAESGPSPDQTAVYATTNEVAGGYTNPIPISFSGPVSSFSVLVTNVIPDNFTVSDNLGETQTLFIASNGQATFNLAGPGITSVNVSSAAAQGVWDFAIDNVTFTPQSTTVPEPASFALFGMATLSLAGYRTWRRRKLAAA